LRTGCEEVIRGVHGAYSKVQHCVQILTKGDFWTCMSICI